MQIHILSAVEKGRTCLSFLRCHTFLERYHAIIYESEHLQVELPPRAVLIKFSSFYLRKHPRENKQLA